jgi:hypothetical protein
MLKPIIYFLLHIHPVYDIIPNVKIVTNRLELG